MYIDTDILYALVKEDDRHAEVADKILSKKEKKYTSCVTLLELEIVIKREINNKLSKETLELFKEKFPKVKIVGFDEKTYRKSQELRKEFDIGIFDSIHAATALMKDKRIASTDNVYEIIPGLKKIDFD